MIIKLADGEALEVTMGDGGHKVSIAIAPHYYHQHCEMEIEALVGDGFIRGDAHRTHVDHAENRTTLTVYGHTRPEELHIGEP